jgi:endogenous inhibitor of DNA gyrase (YacG/DUF329 family)
MIMVRTPKEEIIRMRGEGHSYSMIAATLGISENTVKSFCRRNRLGGVAGTHADKREGRFCRQCGKVLTASPQSKTKRFCSDKCRMAWWKAHPEAVARKAVYKLVCEHCGEAFESYGNKKRKYCSRACYGKSKKVRHE